MDTENRIKLLVEIELPGVQADDFDDLAEQDIWFPYALDNGERDRTQVSVPIGFLGIDPTESENLLLNLVDIVDPLAQDIDWDKILAEALPERTSDLAELISRFSIEEIMAELFRDTPDPYAVGIAIQEAGSKVATPLLKKIADEAVDKIMAEAIKHDHMCGAIRAAVHMLMERPMSLEDTNSLVTDAIGHARDPENYKPSSLDPDKRGMGDIDDLLDRLMGALGMDSPYDDDGM
jgi:hypothetical protein